MKHVIIFLMAVVLMLSNGLAQSSTDMLNEFEPQKNDEQFDGVKVQVGGAFALQYQALSHENAADFVDAGNGGNGNELIELAKNFNLATANMDLTVTLGRGLKAFLRTYMSSRHHPEPYVKGGYFQVDRLDFVKEGFLDNVMDYVTIKVGHMENNYGDAHLRRSDNAAAFYNPFVGNLLMDGFTTEVGGEVYYVSKETGLIVMLGVSNGKLNQDVKDPGETGVAILGKLGFDRTFDNEARVRLTGSIYSIGNAERIYLYSADRTGSRYYSVMESIAATRDNFRSGRVNPGFADELTAIMVNPFVSISGVELFGTYERATGGDFTDSDDTRTWNQFAGELLYRFGADKQFYAGGRYNMAKGKLANIDPDEVSVTRFQVGAGWYLTPNILAKAEYMQQDFKDYPTTNILSEGKFNGIVLESVIAF